MKLISIFFLFSLLISVSLAQSETRTKRMIPRWRRIFDMAYGNTRTTQPPRLSFGALNTDGTSPFRSGDGGGFRG
ncbi:unnamed protein product [Caenorhabditis nigoni]